LLAGLLAYCNSFTKAMIFDDHVWITNNPTLRSLSTFLNSEWVYSRPLISWSLFLNYQLGRLAPFGYHLFNLAVHLAAGALLYLALRRAVSTIWPEAAGDVALAASLLWVVHPLQTQSVTYIIQRCESLMGLFFLLSFYLAQRGLDARTAWPWHLGAVLAALASQSCKEVAPAIPLVVMAYDWVFAPGPVLGILRRRWLLYVGLFAATWGLFLALTLMPSSSPVSAGFALRKYTPLEYLFTQPGVILHYLRLCIWPYPQALDLSDWPVARASSNWLPQGLAIVALVLVTLWALWRRWWPGMLGAWFFFILGPTSSIVPIADLAFEHRMYLSLASVTTLAAVLGRWLLGPGKGGVALLVATSALILATLARNEAYRSAEAFWADNVQARPSNTRAMTALASTLQSRGKLSEALDWTDEAERINPNDGWIYNQRSLIHLSMGSYRQAKQNAAMFRRRVKAHPYSDAMSHYVSGLALLLSGPPDYKAAVDAFRASVGLVPEDGRYRLLLALSLTFVGDRPEAEEQRLLAMKHDPKLPEALERASRRSSLSKPDEDEAIRRGRRALALLDARLAVLATQEKEARPLDTLAIALAADGKFQEAAEAAKKALALSPDDRGIALRLGLFQKGLPYTKENARAAREGGK
jgi:tetratricopeptide (TPR) repeat protein